MYVALDFPQMKKIEDEQKKYNDRMSKLYGVEGFPTVMILDSTGKAYARTGYQEGGAEGYLKHLAELAPRKDEIKKLRDAAGKGSKAEQTAGLEALLAKLAEWEVDADYVDVKEQIVSVAEDKAKKLKYAKELALAFHRRGDADKHAKYLKIVRELDPGMAEGIEVQLQIEKEIVPLFEKEDWKGAADKLKAMLEKTPKGPAGQQVYYYMAICAYRQEDKKGAIGHLEKALECAPEGPLAKDIKEAIEFLKKEE